MTIYETWVERDGKRRSVGLFVRMLDAANVAAIVGGNAGALNVYDSIQEWQADETADRRARVLAKLTDEERALLGVA